MSTSALAAALTGYAAALRGGCPAAVTDAACALDDALVAAGTPGDSPLWDLLDEAPPAEWGQVANRALAAAA